MSLHGARWYDPNAQIFISEDPAAADANLYRYASNDPVNYVDPTGLFTQSPLDYLPALGGGYSSNKVTAFNPSFNSGAINGLGGNNFSTLNTLASSQFYATPKATTLPTSYSANWLANTSYAGIQPKVAPRVENVNDVMNGYFRQLAASDPGYVARVESDYVLSSARYDAQQALASGSPLSAGLAALNRDALHLASWQPSEQVGARISGALRTPVAAYGVIQTGAAALASGGAAYPAFAYSVDQFQAGVREFASGQYTKSGGATLANKLAGDGIVGNGLGLGYDFIGGIASGRAVLNPGAPVNAVRQLRLPSTDVSLTGTKTLGYTAANGEVFLQPGLTRAEQVATLRHEGVHSFLSVADNAPAAGLRQNVGVGAYSNSAFFNAAEEILAEGIASGSLRQGWRHAFNGACVVRQGTRFESVVTKSAFFTELGVGATGLGLFGYGSYELGSHLFGE